MIIIIHGDDIEASRNYFFDLKNKAPDKIVLDGAKINYTDLTQALEGQDLFGDTKQIFIEELVSKRKSSKEIDALVSLLVSHDSSQVTIWESKELTKKQLQQFNNITIKQFDIPKTIFSFLDGLKPNNGKQLIELFHKTLVDKEAEFILFMLQRQTRILLSLSSSNEQGELRSKNVIIPAKSGSQKNKDLDPGSESRMTGNISEVARLAPWQKGKLEKQATLFDIKKLLDLHSQLFELEMGLKTGTLSMPIADKIDLLLISL